MGTTNSNSAIQDVPIEEKAFIEGMSNEDIVKAAVNGSTSLEKILSGDGSIDFRPMSASTAKSVLVEKEIALDCNQITVQQPSRITEVTETEETMASGMPSPGIRSTKRRIQNKEAVESIKHP